MRAQAMAHIRQFFATRNVQEVSTPLLTAYGVTDPHVGSLKLDDQVASTSRSRSLFLRTSPEYNHKRLLAEGSSDIYELGPVFRADEHGLRHRSEFILLEWYRLGWDWRALAAELLELIQSMSVRAWSVEYRSWLSLSLETLGLDASQADPTALQQALQDSSGGMPLDLDHDALLDWWFATTVQPTFGNQTLTVVYDYPAAQAALARLKPGQANWAERFEVFAGPLELANGYAELTDADEQRRRFDADNQKRTRLGLETMTADPDLLDAMRKGLPACAGVAMGFERLLMALNAVEDIEQVCLF